MSRPRHTLRYTIVFVLTGILAVSILIRYGQIMLGGTGPVRQDSGGTTRIERGPILDRNGRILAIQTDQPILSAWIPSVASLENTAGLLGNFLGVPEEELLQRLQSSDGYVVLSRSLSHDQAEAIALLVQQGELRGLSLEEGYRRMYPEDSLAAHVIGFTGYDNQGLEGIELTMNDELSPEQPSPGFGNQVFLTLDTEIQFEMEQIAQQAYEEHGAESVSILVGSGKTGEIYAWATRPTFNLNQLSQSTPEQRRNRIIQNSFEPGSVFKIFSISGIMHLGGIDDRTRFHTAGGYQPPGLDRPITDLSNYGTISPQGIIQYSSNVGAAYASDTISKDDFYYLLRQFGFGQPTGIPLNGEHTGILRSPTQWSIRSKPTMAIGQELGVTALQMFQAATAFANQGIIVTPRIVSQVVSPDGAVVRKTTRNPIRRVLSSSSTQSMLEYMNTATDDTGTGRRARIEGIDISIKTGTAEVVDPETGRYSNERFLASSLALFPTEDPQLIVYIVIDYPKGETYGGRIAAPLVRQAAEFLIPYFGIHRTGDVRITQKPSLQIIEPQLPVLEETIPDYHGISLKTLMPLLNQDTIPVTINGHGWVLSQDPSPGTALDSVEGLTLWLSSDPGDFLAPADGSVPSPGEQDAGSPES